jgi:hypothetical protein
MVIEPLLYEAKAQSCMKLCGHREIITQNTFNEIMILLLTVNLQNFAHLKILRTFTSINQVSTATIFAKAICCYCISKIKAKKIPKESMHLLLTM